MESLEVPPTPHPPHKQVLSDVQTYSLIRHQISWFGTELCCLQTLAEGRTSIFVAHRLSTISNCDKVSPAPTSSERTENGVLSCSEMKCPSEFLLNVRPSQIFEGQLCVAQETLPVKINFYLT
jgi:hypothetical protein